MRNQTFKQRKMKKYHSLKYTKKENQVTNYKANFNEIRNNNVSYGRPEELQQQPTYAAIIKRFPPAHQPNIVQNANKPLMNKPKTISRQNSATNLEIKEDYLCVKRNPT